MADDMKWSLADYDALPGTAHAMPSTQTATPGRLARPTTPSVTDDARAERPACTWPRCRSPLTGRCFFWCECVCHAWSAARAAGRAETLPKTGTHRWGDPTDTTKEH